MKILVVHGRYRSSAPSGENHVVDQEVKALERAGHTVILFERHSDDIESWTLPQKLALPALTVYNPQTRHALEDLLAKTRPDVVHVHNTFPLLTPSVLHACRDAHVPVVATIHNYKLMCAGGALFRNGKTCHDCLSGTALPAAIHGCYRGSSIKTIPVVIGMKANRATWRSEVSAFIFISAAQQQLLQGLDLPSGRVFVKHNFVPRPPERTTAAEHVVAYLGRLDAPKGVPFLMEAWDQFRSARPNSPLRLSIAGGGPLDREVMAWASTRPSVTFHGLLTRDQAGALLRRSLAAVVPSRWEETFGLVAVEAMANAVAPIAPNRGSFPELIHDGKDGVLYSADSQSDLVRVLGDADDHPDTYVRIGEEGRSTFQERFTLETSIDRLLDIYQFAIRNPAGQEITREGSGV